MSFEIHVRGVNSSAESAAVTTAYTNFVAALKAAISHKVDCGGSMLDGKRLPAGDESNPHTTRPGEQW